LAALALIRDDVCQVEYRNSTTLTKVVATNYRANEYRDGSLPSPGKKSIRRR